MALQGLFTLFCLLLFVGAIVHSRCVLILFSVCGLFSIIFLWLLASVYTTASVALADFCHDPTPWVMHIMQDKISKDISSYYLQCAIGRENPFERPIAVSLSTKIMFEIFFFKMAYFFAGFGESYQWYWHSCQTNFWHCKAALLPIWIGSFRCAGTKDRRHHQTDGRLEDAATLRTHI